MPVKACNNRVLLNSRHRITGCHKHTICSNVMRTYTSNMRAATGLLQSVYYLSLTHSQIMTEDLPSAKQPMGSGECIGSVSNVVMLNLEVIIS